MAYSPPPSIPSVKDESSFRTFLLGELRRISQESSRVNTEEVKFYIHHAEPVKVEEATVVYADGTDWNPGSGAGFYGYNGTSWNYLG